MVVVLFGILFCKFEMFNKNKWESLLGSGGSQLKAGRPNFACCLFLSNGLRIKNGFYSFKWLRKQKKDILWYAKIIFIFWCLSNNFIGNNHTYSLRIVCGCSHSAAVWVTSHNEGKSLALKVLTVRSLTERGQSVEWIDFGPKLMMYNWTNGLLFGDYLYYVRGSYSWVVVVVVVRFCFERTF